MDRQVDKEPIRRIKISSRPARRPAPKHVGHLFLVIAIAAGAILGRKVQDALGAPAASANWGPLLVGSIVAVVIDLVYRWRRSFAEPGARRFVRPAEGGVFLMIPVWICGVFGAVLAVVLWSKSRV